LLEKAQPRKEEQPAKADEILPVLDRWSKLIPQLK
jgi:hypothetical protein